MNILATGWEVLFFLILIIEIIVIVFCFFATFILKKLFTKKNLLYSGFVFLIVFGIYLSGLIYENNAFDCLYIINAIYYSIKAFAFEVSSSYVGKAIEEIYFYQWALIGATIMAGFTLISAILGMFGLRFRNWKNRNSYLKNSCEIVIGYGPNAKKYVENNENCIWLLDSKDVINDDLKKYYYEKGYVYKITNDFTKSINDFLKKHKGDMPIFIFDNDESKLPFIFDLISNTKRYSNKSAIYQVEFKNIDSIEFLNSEIAKMSEKTFNTYVLKKYQPKLDNIKKNAKITNKSDRKNLEEKINKIKNKMNKTKNVMASAFSIYELMAMEFSKKNNLAMYLPNGWINNALIDNNKTINVYMLGMGKTNYPLLKSLIYNNQFVTKINNQFKAFKINYYLFDTKKEIYNTSIINLIRNYDENLNGSSGLPRPESTFKVIVDETYQNVESNEFIKKFNDDLLKQDSNTYSFIFVGYGGDVENADYALNLSRIISKDKGTIFYNQDYRKLINDNVLNMPIAYGFKSDVLSREKILNEKLEIYAKQRNKDYSSARTEYFDLPLPEVLQNIYSSLNINFKLSLLGFELKDKSNVKQENEKIVSRKEFFDNDFKAFEESILNNNSNESKDNLTIENAESIKLEEYENVYFNGISNEERNKIRTLTDDKVKYEYNYDNYFDTNLIRNTLIYQEHLRWCVFYIINGYIQFPLTQTTANIDSNDGSIKHNHKDIGNKQHLCLTTFEYLDFVHKYEALLCVKAINKNETNLTLVDIKEIVASLNKDQKTTFDKCLNSLETYQWDAQVLDNFYKNVISKNSDMILVKKA